MDREEFELQGKLQVKVGRTLLRAKLIMCGNALLVAWLVAMILATIWFLVYMQAGASSMNALVGPLLGLTVEQFHKFNGIGLGLFKMAAALLLLCPGIGLRVCGEAMKT